jgi:hypothetical protein
MLSVLRDTVYQIVILQNRYYVISLIQHTYLYFYFEEVLSTCEIFNHIVIIDTGTMCSSGRE